MESALQRHREHWGTATDFDARLAWQRAIHGGGWAAPAWPVENGGRGMSAADQVRCDQVAAQLDAPMLAGQLGIGNVGPTIIVWGTQQQRALLPAMLSGDDIWCQGFSEADAGSDLAALRTRADRDGDEFVINGHKVWMSEGMEATRCMMLARTDRSQPKHAGLSVLLISMDTEGIDRRPLRQMTGQPGFAEAFFTDVRVPRTALLGPLNEGWRVAMTTLGYERTGVIMQAARLEREVIRTISALPERIEEPLLRDALAAAFIEARVLGLLGEQALARLVAGQSPGAAQSVIKLAWSRVMQQMGETLFDVLGTDGLTADGSSESGLRLLRSRSSTSAAGTTEIMRNVLGERVLGLPKG
jgi:alkylation response protein AidB-like acyl-CoA dehydrogenase